MYDNELYHHGVKGQRWGIIRTASQLGHSPKAEARAKAKSEAKAIKDSTRVKAKALKEKAKNDAIINKAKTKSEEKLAKARGETKPKAIQEKQNKDPSELPTTTPKGDKFNQEAGKRLVAKFGAKVMTDVVAPAAIDIGKQVVKSYMARGVNKAFKLEGEDRVYANNKKK